MSIDETTGEKCWVKKISKCRLCRAIYILWRKQKMRGKCQSGPSWMGVVRHLESVHNIRTEEEAKEAMARQRSRVTRDTTAVDSIQQYTKPSGPKSPRFKECVKSICKAMRMGESALASWGATRFHGFHEDGGPNIPTNQSEKCDEVSGGDQADEVVKSIRGTMSQACAGTDISFTCGMWSSVGK